MCILTKQQSICQNLRSKNGQMFPQIFCFSQSKQAARWQKCRKHYALFCWAALYCNFACHSLFVSSLASAYCVELAIIQNKLPYIDFKMPGGVSNNRANVSFEVEDMRCVACKEVLREAIYQCRRGHLLDEKCRNSLLDKNAKEAKCIWSSYIRSLR